MRAAIYPSLNVSPMPIRALVIDDEPYSILPLISLLNRLGIVTRYTSDAENASVELQMEKYDLIIMDWVYSENDGDEVLRFIREILPNECMVPVVIYSGLEGCQFEVPEEYSDMITYVWKKPMRPDEIIRDLAMLLPLEWS